MDFEHLYYVEVECARPAPVGKVSEGIANIIPITGGRFEGKRLSGNVMPLGADWAMRYGGGPVRGRVNTRYILKTDDGAVISLFTKGLMAGSLLGFLRGVAFKRKNPGLYYFRQHLFFVTGDERYAWLNTTVAFAVIGIGQNGRICYDAYMLT